MSLTFPATGNEWLRSGWRSRAQRRGPRWPDRRRSWCHRGVGGERSAAVHAGCGFDGVGADAVGCRAAAVDQRQVDGGGAAEHEAAADHGEDGVCIFHRVIPFFIQTKS